MSGGADPRAAARRVRQAGGRRRGQPGVRRRPSCSPTSSARPAAGSPWWTPSSRRKGRPSRRSSPGGSAREPLQHLTGTAAFRHVELAVGPGVFVPRPETELLAGWAIDRARETSGSPVVVDLCTGSGAIALSVATEEPVRGRARGRARPGRPRLGGPQPGGSAVDLRLGDMADAFPELDGTVDVVVCNPPYIPLEAFATVAPEARDHDPGAGAVVRRRRPRRDARPRGTAARLLRPGGWVGAEHADVQGESAVGVFAEAGRWAEVRDHRDLAGRARFVTARLAR